MRKYFYSFLGIFCALQAEAQSWNITGNAGTDPNTHFIGTTDFVPLKFRISNNHAGEINRNNGQTSFGYGAGQFGSGTYSVAVGYLALYANPGYENVAVGGYAMTNNSGGYNNAVGYSALYNNTSGHSNTAMGYSSLSGNTTGFDNVAFGRDALRNNRGSLGSRNTAVGSTALTRTTNSQYNTAIGYYAGWQYDLGYNNTIVGANCDGRFSGQYNIVAVGQGTICPDNSTARIGNSATWSIGGYAGWSNFSDGRYKKDIQENVKGLEFIMQLRPVTYHLDLAGASKQSGENAGMAWDENMQKAIAEKEKMLFSGFVAQEVEQAAKNAGYEFSGVDKPRNEYSFYALRYADFVVPIVKAVQEQQQLITELQKQNAELQKRLTELERKAGIAHVKGFLSVQPNPAAGKVLIHITADNSSQALVKIFDSKGALVKAQQANLMQGINQVQVDITHLAKGAYHIFAEWDNGQVKRTAQLVKQ